MDQIKLKNMVFYGHTGCFEEEKKNGQKFVVTIEVFFDRITGCNTDKLEDTVNYAILCEKAKAIVESDTGNLIEHLAQQIADMVLYEAPEAASCAVTVGKPDAPVDAVFETMEVRIERTR